MNVPHPEIGVGVGAGVSEIPQPPDSRVWLSFPLGLFFVSPVTLLHETPKKLMVATFPLLSVAVKVPRSRSHFGVGPVPTAGSVAGLMPVSFVTKKFDTLLSLLPEIVGLVISEQEQLPDGQV